MFILKKNVIFLLDIFWIYVFLYSTLQKCVECRLVVKPQNVAILSGEDATLNCASDVSSGNIAWSSPTSSNYIYFRRVLASGISVSDEDDGNCTLQVNTSMAMAKRYVCVELTTAHEASAELIILKSHLECNSLVINESVNLYCSVVYSGNWAPVLECKQYKVGKGVVVLEGSRNTISDNSMVNSTWTYTNYNTGYNIYCLIKFEESGKPSGTSATNIPEYKGTIIAFDSTKKTKQDGMEKAQPLPDANGNGSAYLILFIVSLCAICVLGIVIIFLIIQRKKSMNMVKMSFLKEGKGLCDVPLSTANT